MQSRYNMRSKSGHYIESLSKDDLTGLRKNNPLFRYARINNSIQVWDDIVQLNILYPTWCNDRYDFIKYNRSIA